MIPPRLREILIRFGIWDCTATRGPNIGRRTVALDRDETHTANYRATDLLKLERKGLIEFRRLEAMSAMWGCPWFAVKVTDAGKEEIADEYARRCAEADAANAKLEVKPDPFGEGFVEDVDEERAETSERSEARARQRAAKS